MKNLLKCTDCFANEHGCCSALYDTGITEQACPFYKTEQQFKDECLNSLIRLAVSGRVDLIKKYRWCITGSNLE